MHTINLVRLLAGTALSAGFATAQSAHAQDSAPEAGAAAIAEAAAPVPATAADNQSTSGRDVIVTGSRIPQPNLSSTSPVTVVTSQDVKISGTSRTEDLLNALPQVFATQGSNISNGATGTATISLRGLGSQRTLVLVDGKRLQAGDTSNPVADINFVPSQLIKRVDVLTGGASSVYGADAVAGVVNFVMDRTFTGLRIDGQASVFNHKNRDSQSQAANTAAGFAAPTGWSTNGGAQDISGAFGAEFDDGRGHVTAYATYRSQDPVLESSRDYAFCALNALPDVDPRAGRPSVATTGRNFSCSGSQTSANGTFLQFDPSTFAQIDTFQVSGNQFVSGSTAFNFNPFNYFQRPDERYTFGAFADYEVAPAFKPHLDIMFMDDHSDAQIAPSGDFGDTGVIACDNALLSTQELARVCAPGRTFVGSLNGQDNVEQAVVYTLRRNVEGGGRDNDHRHTDYRIVAGASGDVARGLSYDAYYQFGRTLSNESALNYFSVQRLGRALDVVANPATGGISGVAAGAPVCRAALTGLDPNCVPYNVFSTGGVTAAALNYLETPAFSSGTIGETVAHADVTFSGGEYGLVTPWAESGLGVNFGAEYRKESLDFRDDIASQSGDLAGTAGGSPPVSGDFDVRELFAEVQLPIVQHNFIEDFTVTAGYRYSNYKVAANSFNTATYKLAAELAPIKDVRFRASYNRAVRSPNIVELFFPQSPGLIGAVDPCAGDAPVASQAQCQLTGVTAAQYGHVTENTANQYNVTLGGNPNLLPEKADTFTAGVIVQPRFIPGLALTADYWNIKIKDLISAPSFAGVFQACFAGDAASCALVHRTPGNASLWLGDGSVSLTNQNFAGVGESTNGLDFQGSYVRRLGSFGTLSASFIGTYVRKLNSPVDSPPGEFAGNTPTPQWRHTLRVGFALPNGIGVSGRWRHFSAVHCDAQTDPECSLVIDPDGAGGPLPPQRHPLPGNERLSAQEFFDLTLTARIAERLNLRVGANNILDHSPPVAGGQAIPGGFGNGNTYPQVYDALGRYLFAGFTVDF